MKLNEIKSKVILKGLTMTKLSNIIGLERRNMYLKIKIQDPITLKKIKEFLN
ncbi:MULTISPECIES: hypothetical protein [Psychrilyobacter]|uniref:hypothetical protein n=1 Tax=Psychrilyobacter TaxID=623282 RepID=UPI0013142700|nr:MULTISPECIES: hypothetical protein [Psychrilyobacter]MCS5421879.1 hypothetical protein [Psychrilyobacter sp. S5]NDI76966.1 hypothetical protein [Psychrilyobacter piezotolerans]